MPMTAETETEELVELGFDCDECGGEGEVPSGTCPMCHGEGLTGRWLLSLAEFREVALAREPAEPVLPGRSQQES